MALGKDPLYRVPCPDLTPPVQPAHTHRTQARRQPPAPPPEEEERKEEERKMEEEKEEEEGGRKKKERRTRRPGRRPSTRSGHGIG